MAFGLESSTEKVERGNLLTRMYGGFNCDTKRSRELGVRR